MNYIVIAIPHMIKLVVTILSIILLLWVTPKQFFIRGIAKVQLPHWFRYKDLH